MTALVLREKSQSMLGAAPKAPVNRRDGADVANVNRQDGAFGAAVGFLLRQFATFQNSPLITILCT